MHGGYLDVSPLRQFSPSLIQRFLLIFLLIQLKPKHHRLDVLPIFQRGARGVRGAVFRDTLTDSFSWQFRTFCFAVYPSANPHFASGFRKLPFRSFAFRRLPIPCLPVVTVTTPTIGA